MDRLMLWGTVAAKAFEDNPFGDDPERAVDGCGYFEIGVAVVFKNDDFAAGGAGGDARQVCINILNKIHSYLSRILYTRPSACGIYSSGPDAI